MPSNKEGTPYWPNEGPTQTGDTSFPEEPELEEIDIDQLSPTIQAILALRLAKKSNAFRGDEARMLVSEINSMALGQNINQEKAAQELLEKEQEK